MFAVVVRVTLSSAELEHRVGFWCDWQWWCHSYELSLQAKGSCSAERKITVPSPTLFPLSLSHSLSVSLHIPPSTFYPISPFSTPPLSSLFLSLFFSLSHPPLVLPHRQHASAWKENLSQHRDNNRAESCFVWFCSTQQSKHSKSTNLQNYCKTVINKWIKKIR